MSTAGQEAAIQQTLQTLADDVLRQTKSIFLFEIADETLSEAANRIHERRLNFVQKYPPQKHAAVERGRLD